MSGRRAELRRSSESPCDSISLRVGAERFASNIPPTPVARSSAAGICRIADVVGLSRRLESAALILLAAGTAMLLNARMAVRGAETFNGATSAFGKAMAGDAILIGAGAEPGRGSRTARGQKLVSGGRLAMRILSPLACCLPAATVGGGATVRRSLPGIAFATREAGLVEGLCVVTAVSPAEGAPAAECSGCVFASATFVLLSPPTESREAVAGLLVSASCGDIMSCRASMNRQNTVSARPPAHVRLRGDANTPRRFSNKETLRSHS